MGRHPSKEELRGKPENLWVYAQHLGTLIIRDDILYYKHSSVIAKHGEKLRIVVPQRCQELVIFWAHCHPTARNYVETSTTQHAAQYYYFPGLSSDLRVRVKQCSVCLAKVTKTSLKDTIHNSRQPGFPGKCLAIDLVGPLPETNGYWYVLTAQDEFTRFTKAFPLKNKESATIARVLIII